MLSLTLSGWAQKTDIYQRPQRWERSHDYDVLHYRLEFKFDCDAKTYWGKNTISLLPLKDGFIKCDLDAEDFTVTAVSDKSGRPLEFQQKKGSLSVKLSREYAFKEKVEFTVEYFEKDPQKGLFFVDASPQNPAQINTFAWPEGARHWFPCYDFPNDRVTNEIIATVPDSYKVLSNGRLIDTTFDPKKKTRTFHWLQDKPHATYLMMMAAGPYEVIEDSLGDLPINYWVYKKDVPHAKRSFFKTPEMIDFFNRTFVYEYPWDKYDQICIAGSGGGMEDTSATTLGHGTIHDEKAEKDYPSHGLVAHELAHQWWGDLITARTWSHLWLSESFATYSEYLYSRFDRGADEGAVNLLQKKNRYLREARTRYIRPLVFNRYDNPWNIMDSHSYPKGAVILHMLNFIMGEKPFFRSLTHFLRKHAFQSVDTHDLQTAVKEATGRNMDWFFRQWVYSPGHPRFVISYKWDQKSAQLKLRISQTQDTAEGIPIFCLPVDIGFVTSNAAFTKRIWLHNKDEDFVFDLPRKPLLVRFDKGNFLLKEWTFVKSLEELLFQLQNDDVIGRMWAAEELIRYQDKPGCINALSNCARQDPFWSVRKSAIEVLGKTGEPDLIGLFQEKCRDKNSQVRTAALKILGEFKKPVLVDFFIERFKQEDSYRAQAEVLQALGKCGNEDVLPFLRSAEKLDSPRRVLNRAAAAAIKNITER